MSKDIKNVLVRAQLFVNYYIMSHSGLVVDKKVFTQNFWYSISQLVLSKTSTNKKLLPDDIFNSCRSFSSRYKEIVMDSPVAGYSQCLTAACSYSKHVQRLADYGYQCISVMVKQRGLR
ncbi:hypothetical protein CU097_001351, partial [Rhizopus azygosporus]